MKHGLSLKYSSLGVVTLVGRPKVVYRYSNVHSLASVIKIITTTKMFGSARAWEVSAILIQTFGACLCSKSGKIYLKIKSNTISKVPSTKQLVCK